MTRFSQYLRMRTREPDHFRENVIAVIILLRFLQECHSDENRLNIILQTGEGLTSFNKNNRVNFSVEKK